MKAQSVHMNIDTGEKTWLTPPHIIKDLGQFDLDPCCPPNMPWRTATQMVCRPDDGLAIDWTGKRVWLNPPYGREALPFLRKMAKNKEGGVFCLFLRAPTHLHGKIGYSPMPTASFFFVVVCASATQTERSERRLPRPLRSSHTPRRILYACARAGLEGRSAASDVRWTNFRNATAN